MGELIEMPRPQMNAAEASSGAAETKKAGTLYEFPKKADAEIDPEQIENLRRLSFSDLHARTLTGLIPKEIILALDKFQGEELKVLLNAAEVGSIAKELIQGKKNRKKS